MYWWDTTLNSLSHDIQIIQFFPGVHIPRLDAQNLIIKVPGIVRFIHRLTDESYGHQNLDVLGIIFENLDINPQGVFELF